jgi:hypothetical protein
MTITEIAKEAYIRYSEATNNKNFLGKEMPAFDDLPEQIQNAWAFACDKAIRLGLIYDAKISHNTGTLVLSDKQLTSQELVDTGRYLNDCFFHNINPDACLKEAEDEEFMRLLDEVVQISTDNGSSAKSIPENITITPTNIIPVVEPDIKIGDRVKVIVNEACVLNGIKISGIKDFVGSITGIAENIQVDLFGITILIPFSHWKEFLEIIPPVIETNTEVNKDEYWTQEELDTAKQNAEKTMRKLVFAIDAGDKVKIINDKYNQFVWARKQPMKPFTIPRIGDIGLVFTAYNSHAQSDRIAEDAYIEVSFDTAILQINMHYWQDFLEVIL